MSDENKIRDAADAIKGVVEAVPVYQDAIQPAAKEVGIALQTLTKSIHIILAPISVLVWGYEKIKTYLDSTLAEKLKDVPPERLITPNPIVAVPVLQALLYTAQEDYLRELFANLLATSMDHETAHTAHPSFVEIIKQLSPDEARIINFIVNRKEEINGIYCPPGFPMVTLYLHERSTWRFVPYIPRANSVTKDAGCLYPDLFSSYLDNLVRLQLIEINKRTVHEDYDRDDLYSPLRESLKHWDSVFRNRGDGHADFEDEFVSLTSFGFLFCKACVISNEKKE